MRNVFSKLFSIELSATHFRGAEARFRRYNHVEIIEGNSGVVLGDVVRRIEQPALFYLDGHYSAGGTARGSTDTPVLDELAHILQPRQHGHVILIDDARCFGTEQGYPTLVELQRYVLERSSSQAVCVADDIIRITPSNHQGKNVE